MSGLEIHHMDGWLDGHDPERMLTLCGAHHRGDHRGLLRIEGTASSGFRFKLLDGTVLGEEFSAENSPSAAEAATEFSAALRVKASVNA